MSLADVVVLGLLAAAFVAVCVRVKRHGACMDCGEAGMCTGHCSPDHKKTCAALKGLDQVEAELSRGVT